MLEKLRRLRRRVDELDGEILSLLQARMHAVREIGQVKAVLGLSVYDPEREREILKKAGKFRRIFEAILEVSRDVQRL